MPVEGAMHLDLSPRELRTLQEHLRAGGRLKFVCWRCATTARTKANDAVARGHQRGLEVDWHHSYEAAYRDLSQEHGCTEVGTLARRVLLQL